MPPSLSPQSLWLITALTRYCFYLTLLSRDGLQPDSDYGGEDGNATIKPVQSSRDETTCMEQTTSTVRYLTVDELLYINGSVLNNPKLIEGTQQIRDIDLLEAAVARPTTTAFGQDAYPTLALKAAALLHSVARNHAFANGNKRTATVAAIFMLEVNGQRVDWQPEDALTMILDTAQGKQSLESFVKWLRLRPCPSAPKPDADHDMALIDAILREHRWLLDELDKQ